jgi:hypothetical protein
MSNPTIRNGDHGDLVTQAQNQLNSAGYSPGAIDGWFGPNTEAAVVSYQMAYSLQVDGVIGNQTWASLNGDSPEPPGTTEGHGGAPQGPITLHVSATGDRQSDTSVVVDVGVTNNGQVPAPEGLECQLRVVNPGHTENGAPFEATLQKQMLPAIPVGGASGLSFSFEAQKLEHHYWNADVTVLDASGQPLGQGGDDFH